MATEARGSGAAPQKEVVLELDGREVRITSPGKVFFPERGETKLDLVRYYEAVREPLLAVMGGRPVLLQRFPEGAGGSSFFQKRVPKDVPDWLETTIVSTPHGTTSNALGAADLATAAWWKEERGRRVFVDYNQNSPHKTVFGAWSVRARPGGQASAPFTWDELDTIDPEAMTVGSLPARVAERGDPWRDAYGTPQSLEPLLALPERDMAAGLQAAPWPPVYPKMPNEPPRVAPSRARKTT